MIIAELNGKIPSKLNDKEDILTSNVFSFFKYSDRQLFKDYLSVLGIEVSLNESENAEFIFWPSYEDGTEPDLVVICGKYYLLFEAKLYSDFSPKTATTESQIEREIKMGKMSAENLNKAFIYIAITAEYYKDRSKYQKYEKRGFLFVWTNWQFISSFIEKKLEYEDMKQNRNFASDLYLLLVKKNLRAFQSFEQLNYNYKYNRGFVFFESKTAKFRGKFIGSSDALSGFLLSSNSNKNIYYKNRN